MKQAKFECEGRTQRGEVVKENKHTVLVRLLNGDIVKRHKRRHGVAEAGEE